MSQEEQQRRQLSQLRTNMPSPRHNYPDTHTRAWKPPPKVIDEEEYRTAVLHLPTNVTEDDIDDRLNQEVQALGVVPLFASDIGDISSSLSATTISSERQKQSSILSHSTASTSRSSTEHRPARQASIISENSIPTSPALSIASDADKKKDSGFKRGFRKMATFTKRRSSLMTSSTINSLHSDSTTAYQSDRASMKSELKSPESIKSSKSSWSSPPPPPPPVKPVEEEPAPVDPQALKRSMESRELLDLRALQLEEYARFLHFQQVLLNELHQQRDNAKTKKMDSFSAAVVEAQEKVDKAVEELESRQLEDEMKLQKEHDVEKRIALIRLRYMEAYCQNPTPPPTPVDHVSGRQSLDSLLPERRVTEKDYHNLAQQYRERDTMESLHAAKINVLRGRQKKTVENFSKKKEREIENIERDHQKDLDNLDSECAAQEAGLRLALATKRARLESRWKIQSLIERTKIERATGLSYAPLPMTSTADDAPLGLGIEYSLVVA